MFEIFRCFFSWLLISASAFCLQSKSVQTFQINVQLNCSSDYLTLAEINADFVSAMDFQNSGTFKSMLI